MEATQLSVMYKQGPWLIKSKQMKKNEKKIREAEKNVEESSSVSFWELWLAK